MSHVTIPREPTPSLLRPFIGCNTQELHEAWAAMVRIAEVEHARSGSQCLTQIEEPTQPVAEICSANHDEAEFGERAIRPLQDLGAFEYGTKLYAAPDTQAAPALEAPAALSDAEIISAQELHYQAKLEAGQETVCTCPSGDGSLRWPCPTHPPAVPTPELQRMTAGRATYFMERFLREEKLLGPNEQAALRFVINMLEAPVAPARELPGPDLWRDASGLRGYKKDPGQGPWYTADTVHTLLAAAPKAPAPDLADAYTGAREELSIWKRRALEAERNLRAERETTLRLVAEVNAANGPTHMGEAAPQAPAAPDDVLCYIRAGATLPDRHGFEVCRATDFGAMAVMGDGRAHAMPTVTPAESTAPTLRAMALNYTPGHSWDHLDADACLKGAAEIDRLRALLAQAAVPAAPAVDALDATDRECLAIGRAVNRAALELPADGEIRIDIENGAGAVYVYEPQREDHRYIDSGDVFSAQINAAIDAANAAAKGAA